jgi:hypothetical protein
MMLTGAQAFSQSWEWDASISQYRHGYIFISLLVHGDQARSKVMHQGVFHVQFYDSHNQLLKTQDYTLGPFEIRNEEVARVYEPFDIRGAVAARPAGTERVRVEDGGINVINSDLQGPKVQTAEGHLGNAETSAGEQMIYQPPHPLDAGCNESPSNPVKLIQEASEIVTATALAADGESIRFKVENVLKGTAVVELLIPGELSTKDDLNRGPVPYTKMRNAGVADCFAHTYKIGNSYLLILGKDGKALTPYWAPASPTTEQIHVPDDAWVLWVQNQIVSQRQ